jgi:hypothetical protein
MSYKKKRANKITASYREGDAANIGSHACERRLYPGIYRPSPPNCPITWATARVVAKNKSILLGRALMAVLA